LCIVSAAGSSNGAASDYSLPGRLSFPLITPYPPYPGSSPLGLVSTHLLIFFLLTYKCISFVDDAGMSRCWCAFV